MAFIRKKPKHIERPSDFKHLLSPDDVIEFAIKNNIETEPLDISELTKSLGIIMNFEPMAGDDSGSLVKKKKTGQWVMTVNSLHHPHRQRFTIAHEIGHRIKHGAFCDNFEDKTFFRNGASNAMETEANIFAAQLLMPKNAFDTYIKTISEKVEDIARNFQVSSMAVRIRAKQLGYEGHNI